MIAGTNIHLDVRRSHCIGTERDMLCSIAKVLVGEHLSKVTLFMYTTYVVFVVRWCSVTCSVAVCCDIGHQYSLGRQAQPPVSFLMHPARLC